MNTNQNQLVCSLTKNKYYCHGHEQIQPHILMFENINN